jgi:hypothetical protein
VAQPLFSPWTRPNFTVDSRGCLHGRHPGHWWALVLPNPLGLAPWGPKPGSDGEPGKDFLGNMPPSTAPGARWCPQPNLPKPGGVRSPSLRTDLTQMERLPPGARSPRLRQRSPVTWAELEASAGFEPASLCEPGDFIPRRRPSNPLRPCPEIRDAGKDEFSRPRTHQVRIRQAKTWDMLSFARGDTILPFTLKSSRGAKKCDIRKSARALPATPCHDATHPKICAAPGAGVLHSVPHTHGRPALI